MNFVPFKNNAFNYTLVHVELDEAAGLIRRTYDGVLPTVSGQINPYEQTSEQITEAFYNEIHWLTVLKNTPYVPELVDVIESKQQIIQKYYEPSLLLTGKRPSVMDIIEMYKCFGKFDMNKCNGSLSNLSYNGSQLIAFDYKHAQYRPLGQEKEFKSYNIWLSKIDPSLTTILTEMYHDNKTEI